MSPAPIIPSKRPSESSGPASSKQRRHYHHKHRTNVKQPIENYGADIIQNDDIVTLQLERAIQLVLQAVGFSHAEPAALQSLRYCVEEYMARFLESVRQSMSSARRVQPVPHDFLAALTPNHLTLRSLLLHLDPPVSSTESQPPLRVEERSQDIASQEAQLINKLLTQATITTEPHVPRSFPSLPSHHTFRADRVERNQGYDQKQIREQATEEARLGEEALRRLMSKKASGDNALLTGLRAGSKLSLRQRSRALWRETYEEAIRNNQAQQGDTMDMDGKGSNSDSLIHIGPAVNADSIYWRKPIARKITENVLPDG